MAVDPERAERECACCDEPTCSNPVELRAEPVWNAGWQMVTCKDCKSHFQCTPSNDYYNSANATDGVCETCLVTAAGLNPADTVTVVVDR